MFKYQKIYQSQKSKARLGRIQTTHGNIETPAFVPVATKGTIKSLAPETIRTLKLQISFVNTYHLVTHPGTDIIHKAGGIHTYSNLQYPLMSDSGGFQVFSLGRQSHQKTDMHGPKLLKITENGVTFRSVFDGQIIEFSPELSMHYQSQIGTDIIMAFDECIPADSSHTYTQEATSRTHRWLDRCIDTYNQNQALYGIIQGGAHEDLRKISAQYVLGKKTLGIAIGGVSVGESKIHMYEQVRWASEVINTDIPTHLLGVGYREDILYLVRYGIDTFDCVEPTRIARKGIILTEDNKIDITDGMYRYNLEPASAVATSPIHHYTKSYIHHLFKSQELLGYTLVTAHNLHIMELYMQQIRMMIANDMI